MCLAKEYISTITKAEKHIICGNKGENEKNVRKLVALQKVNRIMNNKPWAINRFHIEVRKD